MDLPLGRLTLSRSALDRSAHLRRAGLVERLRVQPDTRVLTVVDGRAPVRADTSLALTSGSKDLADLDDDLWIYLGQLNGRHYLAQVPTREPAESPADLTWLGLREVGERLSDRDAGMFVCALALANWHATHTHCSRCGTPTAPDLAGWIRRCPNDGSEHYPRTDPAVIVTTVDADDRVLLGHNPTWPEGRYSTLAGFVEPGESLEDAVRREVAEESGVMVGAVRYLGSQPWPFPASLMLGCTAVADRVEITVDGTEVSDARWFTRDELADEIRAGRVVPPSGVSIARRLVERWFGGPLPTGPTRW